MKRCPYCQSEVNDRAVRCPHCHRSVVQRAEMTPQLIWVLVGIAVVLGVLFVIGEVVNGS